jgi:hypothetical protein
MDVTTTKVVKSLNLDVWTWMWTLTFGDSMTTKVQYPIRYVQKKMYICIDKVDVNRCGRLDGGRGRNGWSDTGKVSRTFILTTLQEN